MIEDDFRRTYEAMEKAHQSELTRLISLYMDDSSGDEALEFVLDISERRQSITDEFPVFDVGMMTIGLLEIVRKYFELIGRAKGISAEEALFDHFGHQLKQAEAVARTLNDEK